MRADYIYKVDTDAEQELAADLVFAAFLHCCLSDERKSSDGTRCIAQDVLKEAIEEVLLKEILRM